MNSTNSKFFFEKIVFEVFHKRKYTSISFSITLYRSSIEFRKRNASAIDFQPSTVCCSKAAFKMTREASHLTRVSQLGL